MFSASRVATARAVRAGSKRQFHAYSKVLNEKAVANTTSQANVIKTNAAKLPKKRHPIRNFILQVTLATVLFYGAGTYASLKNDTFNDYYTEYVPFADELVQLIEDNQKFLNDEDLIDLRRKVTELKDKTVSVAQQGALSEKVTDAYAQVKSKSEDLFTSSSTSSPPTPIPANSGNAGANNNKAAAAARPPVVSNKLQLPRIEYKSTNDQVNSVVSKVNSLILLINENTVAPASSSSFSSLISNITDSIETISNNIKAFESSKEELTKDLTAKLTADNALTLKKQENELISKFLSDFNREIGKIKDNYEKNLAHDVELTRKSVEVEFENKLKLAQIEQLKAFEQNITTKIESERNNKLKNLNELFKKVEFLENFEIELFNNFEKFTKYNQLNVVLNNLKKFVINPETYGNNLNELNGTKILNEINKLAELTKPAVVEATKGKNLTSEDDLITLSIKALPADNIRTTGLLSNAQLIQRWNLLVPELRSASLLPPNAGLLGHLSAKFFSYFLISKQGNVPTDLPAGIGAGAGKPLVDSKLIGNDIESVISRVNYNLSNGDLDNAIETVSNLKGWSRKLSNDWLVEARKKLELEFLVDLIETEIKYSY